MPTNSPANDPSISPTNANDAHSASATHSDAMNALLARNWGFVLLRGILALIVGILAILLPGLALASLILLFSAYMLADGIFAIVSAVRAARKHERWGWLVFEGVADIAAGALAFFWPGITILVFVALMSAWAIISGVMMLASTFQLHGTHGRWLMGLAGLLSIVWGACCCSSPRSSAHWC